MGTKVCKNEKKVRKKDDKTPKYRCKSCEGRASKEKFLCKPKKIK